MEIKELLRERIICVKKVPAITWCNVGTILTLYGDKYRKIFLDFVYKDSIVEKEYFRKLHWYEKREWWDKMPDYLKKGDEVVCVKKWSRAFEEYTFSTVDMPGQSPEGWMPATMEDYIDSQF
jgi:hypothetical protein